MSTISRYNCVTCVNCQLHDALEACEQRDRDAYRSTVEQISVVQQFENFRDEFCRQRCMSGFLHLDLYFVIS